MSKTEKSGLVPRLRFPEFLNEGEWERKKLSDLLVETKQRNRKLKYGPQDVLSVSGEYGCVNQIEFMGRSYAGVSVKDYHIVETGDVVYTKSPLKKNPFGIIKENTGKTGIVSTLYAVYRTTDIGHPAYLAHYFSSDYNLNSYLQPIVKKGAKNDMKVNNADVLSGEILAPKKEEQVKISDFLSSIDTLIKVEIKQLSSLAAYKKSLTRQLFPCDGESVPRMRFPEFRNDPSWIPSKLGDVSKIQSGGTPSRSNMDYWGGTIPWVTTSLIDSNTIIKVDEYITSAGLEKSSAKVFPKNTILMAMYGQGKTRGKVAMLGIDAATNQACAAFILKNGVETEFVFQNLASRYEEIRKISNPGGQANLSAGLIEGITFSYPENKREQTKIAGFLSTIDELIAAQRQKIEGLKAHKESLMQKLFPVLDKVQL